MNPLQRHPGLGPVRSALCVAGVVFLLLAADALLPRTVPSRTLATPLRALLVDASGSVRRARPGWAGWIRAELAAEAANADESQERVCVIAFARDVALSLGPAEPEDLLAALRGTGGAPLDPLAGAGADDGTDLAGALDLAAGLFPTESPRPGTLVVFGDATFTGRDPAPRLLELERAGVQFRVAPPPPPELTDLSLVELDLPSELEEGAPMVALVRVGVEPRSAAARAVRIHAEVEDEDGVRELDRRAEVPPGAGSISLALPLGAARFGRNEVQVRVLCADPESDPDPVPENDERGELVHVEGELVVLVAAEPSAIDAARSWLAPGGRSLITGIQFRFTDPERLPRLLDRVDALVTFDLAPEDLPGALLERFIERGGGWLATSGSRLLARWVPGEERTGVRRLLPLEPAPPDGGRREVLLLVDGSGSMDGAPFEMVRSAALDLVDAALPTDRVVLRFFNVGLREPHEVKPWTDGAAQDREAAVAAARALVDLTVPSGDTWILSSLEELARSRAGAREEALVLLLTDGLDRGDPTDRDERIDTLLRDLAAAKTRLVPVAIGADADMAFLDRLAGPGASALRPGDREELARFFQRTVEGARCREGADLALLREPAAPGSLAERLAGDAGEVVGHVERFVKNRVPRGASGVEVLWRGDDGEPVLAIGRAGLGRTALFGSLPASGWAPAFAGRRGLGEPARFAPLLRYLARGPARRTEGPSLELDLEESPRFVLRGLDPAWPPAVDLEVLLGGDAVGPAAFTIELVPPPADPALDPIRTRVGSAPLGKLRALDREGLVLLRVRGPEGEAGPADAAILEPFEAGPPQEFDPTARGRIAGDLEHPPGPVGSEEGAGRGVAGFRRAASPLAPWWLVGAALSLFLGYVRLPGRWRRMGFVTPRRGVEGGQGIGGSDR